MVAKKKRRPPPALPPKIYEATLAPGVSGAVIRGAEIDQRTALGRRKTGENVVVCGDSLTATRSMAYGIESAIGPCERHKPHDQLAGALALPHFQQTNRALKGHTFYETENRKAKAKP